jgi:hypothetical protein
MIVETVAAPAQRVATHRRTRRSWWSIQPGDPTRA